MSADKELKAFIDRILRLKEEQDAIGGDIRDIYGEAKGRGYDKTVMGKLVAYLRKIEKAGSQTVDEQESIFETYLASYQGTSGTRVATHTHETDHNRETGEVRDINPRLAKQIVDGMQTEAGRAALVAAVDIMIEGVEAEENQESAGSLQASDTSLTARELSPEAAVVDERSPAFVHTNSPETVSDMVGGFPVAAAPFHAEETGDGTDRHHNRSDMERRMRQDVTAGETAPNSEIAPASQGEAEAPSVEGVNPNGETSSPAANAGGDQEVTALTIPTEARETVSQARAHKPLRPLCLRPEACGGYGDKTCHSCLVAARTTGEAA